jgi:uncharacterized protein with GYD domain
MAKYLFEVGYTAESWKAQLRSAPNVVERITPLAEGAGGRIDTVYYAFGRYDAVVIADFPDDEAAAAFSLAATAGGAVRSVATVKLLTVEQGQSAMRKASAAAERYKAPV